MSLLTHREQSILTAYAEAENHITEREVATLLGVSRHTVKSRMPGIFLKLEVSGRAAAINKARLLGEISPGVMV